MSRDICQVISQLQRRWLDCYGDHIGVEEIRRTMSRMLADKQAEELQGTFACWSATDLAEGIRDSLAIDRDHTLTIAEVSAPDETIIAETPEDKPKTRHRRTHAELAAAGHPGYSK